MTKTTLATLATTLIIGASIIALHPTLQINPDSIIGNTTISSTVLDANGYAIAFNPTATSNYQLSIDTHSVTLEEYQH